MDSHNTSRLALFDHIQCKQKSAVTDSIESDAAIHPAITKLGALYRTGMIADDDERIYALLIAFINVIADYKTPPNKTLSWDLDKHFKTQVQHLVSCRQHSMSMGGVIKFIRLAISQISPEISESEAKTKLTSQLRTFIDEKLHFARNTIAQHGHKLIQDGDVVLTYGYSTVVCGLLLDALDAGREFRVVVADSRPLLEGVRTLHTLTEAGGHVTYTPLTGISAAMKDTTKVLLGATSLLSNGAMLAAVGTALVSSVAKAAHVPVLFASESYKFTEKVQLDAIVYNELGSPLELIEEKKVGGVNETLAVLAAAEPSDKKIFVPRNGGFVGPLLSDPVAKPNYQLLNLRYDVTPIRNVSAIVTEVGLIPPTSIPVLIRELRLDQTGNEEGAVKSKSRKH